MHQLGGDWMWRTGEVVPANAYDPHVTDKGWNFMSVPGNWFLQGQDLTGQVWMRRIVQAPVSRRGQRATQVRGC